MSWHAGIFGGRLRWPLLLRERWPDRWARLSYGLGLDDTELVRWRTVAETMFTGWNSQTGLFEQFAGFFGLEEIDLGYAGRSVPMDVVLGRSERSAPRSSSRPMS